MWRKEQNANQNNHNDDDKIIQLYIKNNITIHMKTTIMIIITSNMKFMIMKM